MPPGGDTEEVPERQQAEALFLENLDWIRRSAASLCRRYGLTGDQADEACSWCIEKLIDHDYAPLRKFRGDSSIRTYLVVVVAALFRDYRASHWGRWRPSAAALRAGHLAMRLETLVYRDGCTLDQAARTLRAAGETELSDRELAAMLEKLPVRGPLRPYEAGEAPLETITGETSADDAVDTGEAEQTRGRVLAALARVLAELPAEDRLILRHHYWNGLSVADVARALRLPQKPLYRRIEGILRQLRRGLVAAGVQPEQMREFLGRLPGEDQAPEELREFLAEPPPGEESHAQLDGYLGKLPP
ncbi:MAG TPA: sigma-70 family RNA polymerase sigma factor [Longimicrobium sp.]|nr:sigma-70 family RNA polymerase sigma factor [Longimicrobium sp.]